MLEKVPKEALHVVLDDYTTAYRDLLAKVSKPTLYFGLFAKVVAVFYVIHTIFDFYIPKSVLLRL